MLWPCLINRIGMFFLSLIGLSKKTASTFPLHFAEAASRRQGDIFSWLRTTCTLRRQRQVWPWWTKILERPEAIDTSCRWGRICFLRSRIFQHSITNLIDSFSISRFFAGNLQGQPERLPSKCRIIGKVENLVVIKEQEMGPPVAAGFWIDGLTVWSSRL